MVVDPNARERILDAAQALFFERGYSAVRLRDVGEAVGMRHASLYYHVPGGKEQLFLEVMERSFRRHRAGLESAIAGAGTGLTARVRAVARWFGSQAPVDLPRMARGDMREIAPEHAVQLMRLAYDSLREPIVAALSEARAAGELAVDDLDFAAMALVTLVQGAHAVPEPFRTEPRERTAERLADMLLDGWRSR